MATRRMLGEASELWRKQGGVPIAFESLGGVEAARRVRDGEAFDVVVLAVDAIDSLVEAGRIMAASKVAVARSGVAIAVRESAASPAIDSEEALRQTVLSAGSIGYSTGPSGVALQRLFARWGIDAVIRARLVQAPPGVPVAMLLARGDVTLGFQQLSELMHVEGIRVLGPLPPGLEIVTTFAGGVCAASAQPDMARAVLEFIRSPAGDAARRRFGLEPA